MDTQIIERFPLRSVSIGFHEQRYWRSSTGGNVITFSDEGKTAVASEIDANDFPVQVVPQ